MGCYRPIRAAQQEPGGRLRLHTPPSETTLQIGCGRCIGCRTAYAQQWKHRAVHEARLHAHNRFLTLTYDDEHLPPEGLVPDHLRDFWKRLRVTRDRYPHRFLGGVVRYLASGEYGERTKRAHYHACLFGLAPTDEKKCGRDLYSSELLQEIWGFGNVRIGHFTPATAAYVAGYTVKKLEQGTLCDADGVVVQPPFLRASRRPAIGLTWLNQHYTDLRHGYLVDDGQTKEIPEYYLRKLKDIAPNIRQHICDLRVNNANEIPKQNAKNHPDRLKAAEIIHHARNQFNRSKRGLSPL